MVMFLFQQEKETIPGNEVVDGGELSFFYLFLSVMTVFLCVFASLT